MSFCIVTEPEQCSSSSDDSDDDLISCPSTSEKTYKERSLQDLVKRPEDAPLDGNAAMVFMLASTIVNNEATKIWGQGMCEIDKILSAAQQAILAVCRRTSNNIRLLLPAAIEHGGPYWYRKFGKIIMLDAEDLALILTPEYVSDIDDFAKYSSDCIRTNAWAARQSEGTGYFDNVRHLLQFVGDRCIQSSNYRTALHTLVDALKDLDTADAGRSLTEESLRQFYEFMIEELMKVIHLSIRSSAEGQFHDAAGLWRTFVTHSDIFTHTRMSKRPGVHMHMQALQIYQVLGRRAASEVRAQVLSTIPVNMIVSEEIVSMMIAYALENDRVPQKCYRDLNRPTDSDPRPHTRSACPHPVNRGSDADSRKTALPIDITLHSPECPLNRHEWLKRSRYWEEGVARRMFAIDVSLRQYVQQD